MKRILLVTALMFPATTALADGFIMGSGRWTCQRALEAAQSGSPIEQGQLVGWILGFWSSATLQREDGFVDKVESAGGRAVYDATLGQCQKAPPDTLLYKVSQSMIRNTR